ncbi:MAG: LAGLIDADG family homing endonuclease [Nitrososphaerales archaeon]|nr:LAGLIDADG family homing endonuclease [Nitrososphaerales archaeon]
MEKKTGIGNIIARKSYGNHFGNRQVYEWIVSADQHCELLLGSLKRFFDYQGGTIRHPPITRINWGFVAGFFDGEGGINFQVHEALYQLSITQKERQVLDAIQKFIGYGVIYGPYRGNPFRLLIAGHKDQLDFIDHVLPFSSVKRKSLLEAKKFIQAKDWNADDKLRDVPLERLVADYGKLRSIRRVAAKHGVTYNAIHDKFERSGLKMQPLGTNQFGSLVPTKALKTTPEALPS